MIHWPIAWLDHRGRWLIQMTHLTVARIIQLLFNGPAAAKSISNQVQFNQQQLPGYIQALPWKQDCQWTTDLLVKLWRKSKCRLKLILRLICYPRLKRSLCRLHVTSLGRASSQLLIPFPPGQRARWLIGLYSVLGQQPTDWPVIHSFSHYIPVMKGDWVRSWTELTSDLNSPFHDHHYWILIARWLWVKKSSELHCCICTTRTRDDL